MLWPGNVRELQNVIERACALAEGEMITLAELPQHLRTWAAGDRAGDDDPGKLTLKEAKERWVSQLEAAYVAELLTARGRQRFPGCAQGGRRPQDAPPPAQQTRHTLVERFAQTGRGEGEQRHPDQPGGRAEFQALPSPPSSDFTVETNSALGKGLRR